MRPGPGVQLTPRQREVLQLVATGANYKDIACRLGVTTKTARNHLANLYLQLDIHTRAEAVLCAMQLGLVDVPGLFDEANALSTKWPAVVTMASGQPRDPRRDQEGVNGRSS